MTVPVQTPINRHTANGVTTVFTYTFKVLTSGDLEVSLDGVVQTTGFTVSGIGANSGSVTFTTAPAFGVVVVLRRVMAYQRTTDYQDQGAMPASTVDDDHDATVMMVQQVAADLQSALTYPVLEGISGTLPAASVRANKLLGFDSAGAPVMTAPASGSAAELALDLASSGSGEGADMIGFKQSGAGAVARTATAKMRETVSAADFGAVGDGVTDDTAAILAAVAALSTGSDLVLQGPGTYKITSTITLSGSGKSITGRGRPVIKKVGAGNFDAIVVTGSSCRVTGIEVDGNSVGWSGVVVKGEHNTVRDVVSHHNGGCGILLDGQSTTCAYNTVENCRSYLNSEIGIGQNTALASRILGNICQDNGLEGITIDLPSYRSVVDGNQVIGNCVTGGVGGIGIDQAYLSVISNNLISGTLSSLPGLTFQCNVGDTTFCSVTGNVFVDNAGGGVRLRKTGSFHSSLNVISGNVFLNNGGKSIEIDLGCDNNVIGANQYNGVWPIDNGTNNRKQAGAVFFRVANNTVRTNVTGDGTWYTVPFEVEQSDPESRVSAGVFTAPMRGLYSFQAAVRLSGGAGHGWGQISFVATGATATMGTEVGTEDIFPLAGGTTFLLNAGDTVQVQVRVGGGPGTKVLDVEAAVNECWFTGHLVG